MRFRACELFDHGQACGAEANMAKYLAANNQAGKQQITACNSMAVLDLPMNTILSVNSVKPACIKLPLFRRI